jgi:hypothetical protein
MNVRRRAAGLKERRRPTFELKRLAGCDIEM